MIDREGYNMYNRTMEEKKVGKRRGAKPKQERTIAGPVTLNVHELKTVTMNFLVQPSLRDLFVKVCQEHKPAPLVPSDVHRSLMIRFIEEELAFIPFED